MGKSSILARGKSSLALPVEKKGKQAPKAKGKPVPKAKAKQATTAKKKPAAASSEAEAPPTMNATIDSLKAGVDETPRDKGKAQKYAKERENLPDYVKVLIEEESRKSGNARNFKSQAINKLYIRQSDGSLKLNLQDPLFQEASTMYEKNYSATMDDAYPPGIMKNLFFRGDQAAFDDAVRDGDIYQTESKKGGKCFWAFTKYRVASEEGKQQDHRLQSSKAVGTAVAAELLQAFQSDLDKTPAHTQPGFLGFKVWRFFLLGLMVRLETPTHQTPKL